MVASYDGDKVEKEIVPEPYQPTNAYDAYSLWSEIGLSCLAVEKWKKGSG